jgi:predicted peptidase
MSAKLIGPLALLVIILGFSACRKNIAPIPQSTFKGQPGIQKPQDSTDTDSSGNATDSSGKAKDSTANTVDSTAQQANSQDNVVESAPPVHTAVTANVNANVAGFWQSVPARYTQTTKKYPLIVFIHGIGELGTNLSRMNCCGLPNHLKNKTFPPDFEVKGKHYSFLVMSPQFKKRPTPADIQSVVDFARKRFRVDPARIYITGLSMGGGSTWDYSAVYGQVAAAIVPVCGGTKPTSALAANIASKDLPVWTLHSTADAAVPVKWAEDWINWIDRDNPSIAANTKLTVWNSLSHNSTWAKAFNPSTRIDGMNIYEWMLQYRRG